VLDVDGGDDVDPAGQDGGREMIVGGLIYFPMLILGPIGERFIG
jgi:hypothetical protein